MSILLFEAQELKNIAHKTGMLLCLTHTYTVYPMIKEVKQQMAESNPVEILKNYVKYSQGWLSKTEEVAENKHVAWRTDPKKGDV